MKLIYKSSPLPWPLLCLRIFNVLILINGIIFRVNPSLLYIHTQEHWHSKPNHEHEEEKRVADISCAVSDNAHDQRTNERARLSMKDSDVSGLQEH
jgi:hypothetical protein